MQFVVQSRQGGMAVCRHEQNEESNPEIEETQQQKSNSAQNPSKQAETKPLELKIVPKSVAGFSHFHYLQQH